MQKVAKVVGLNSDYTCAQTLICENREGFDLLVLISGEGEDAFSKIRGALSESEGVFGSSNQTVTVRLQEVFDSLQANLTDLSNIQLVCASIESMSEGFDRPLHLIIKAVDIEAYLFREGSKTEIVVPSLELQQISGFLRSGDRLVMATHSLTSLIGDDKLIHQTEMDIMEEEVSSRLPQGQVFPTAAIIVELSSHEKISENQGHIVAPRVRGRNLSIMADLLGKVVPRSKKSTLILGAIILMVVVAGVLLNLKNQSDTKLVSQFNTTYQLANQAYDKAVSLKDLDTTGAKLSLDEAEKNINLALEQKPNDGSAQDLKQKIIKSRPEILKVTEVAELPVWLDLELIKSGFITNKLSSSLDKLVLLDSSGGSLVEVGLKDKTQQVLAGSDKLGEAKLASINGASVFVYSMGKGIVKVDTENKTTSVVAEDDEWGEISEVVGFGSNFYLLDKIKNQIFKYVPVEKGYAGKANYLKGDTKADFSGVMRMRIDSSVWVLQSSGQLLKFTQGLVDNFGYSGLDKNVISPKSFFVSDETDKLYLLDSGNNRLLILDKAGKYQSSYQGEIFGKFSDLVVNDQENKVFLIDNSKIYVMELK